MKVQCKYCLPKEGIEVPDFAQSVKQELLKLTLKSPMQTIKHLIGNLSLNPRDAKFIVTHINTNYGHCNRCIFDKLHEEYIKCPVCDALNFNWKMNTPVCHSSAG